VNLVLYRMIAGFVGIHILEDVGLLTIGRYVGPYMPAWIFFPVGILVSAVLFAIFAKKIIKA
jgi:hypothetical protein